MSYTNDMAECLDACSRLDTKRSWFGLGTSPQGRCQASCQKTVRYQTGYGDPDEIYQIAVDAMIQAEFEASAGTPSLGGGDTYYSNGNGGTTESRQGDPTLMLGAAALIAGLLFLGMRK